MPFDDNEHKSKVGLKQVSSQPSIFDNMPKKPSQEDFNQQVQKVQEKKSQYNAMASELIVEFSKSIKDKTLPQNKTIFQKEIETELLSKMVKLAAIINNDGDEQEGMGSLGWITLLFKTAFAQRDRINILEYNLSQIEKKMDVNFIKSLIVKELSELDKVTKNG